MKKIEVKVKQYLRIWTFQLLLYTNVYKVYAASLLLTL